MEPWVVIAVVISSVMSNHVPLPYRTFDFVEISSRAVSLEESRLRTQFKPFSGNDSFVSQPIWPGNQALQAHAFYMTHTIYIVLQPTINTPCEMDNLNTNYHTNGIASCELPRDQEGGSNAVPRTWIDVPNQGDDFEAKSIDYWRNRWLIIVDVYRDYIDICVGYLCRYGLMILLAFVAILTRLRANAFEYNHRTMQSILFLTFAAILPPTLFAWEDGGEDVHSIIGHEYDSHSNYLDPYAVTDLTFFGASYSCNHTHIKTVLHSETRALLMDAIHEGSNTLSTHCTHPMFINIHNQAPDTTLKMTRLTPFIPIIAHVSFHRFRVQKHNQSAAKKHGSTWSTKKGNTTTTIPYFRRNQCLIDNDEFRIMYHHLYKTCITATISFTTKYTFGARHLSN
eukprot:438797_1